jgi:hypothetical protein
MQPKKKSKIDPHHCKCFSIPKLTFKEFSNKLLGAGYAEPLLEEDHGQIIGFTKRLSQNYQIHVKLLRTGRIEAEIEYPPDYPFAHLNSIHSFSAHNELNLLLIGLQITYKCKLKPPTTCVHRQIIPANQPIKMDDVLKLGGIGAVADLIFNDGKITSKVIDVLLKEVKKNIQKKSKRRKYLK